MLETAERDPDIVFTDSVWAYADASPGQRAAAYVLDTLIVAVIFGILKAAAGRFAGVDLPDVAGLAASIAYFVFLQSVDGQTLGKKAVGIRVLPLDQSEAGDRVPHVRLILRETIWKFLGALLLGYGFLRILIRADRSALHDQMTRTRVVSLNREPTSSPVRLSTVLGGLVALALIGAAATYYVVNYTAYPLQKYANALEMMGLKVGPISGSLAHGYRIESISQQSDDYDFELKGIEFHFGTGDKNGKKQFIVRDLSLASARVNIRRLPESFAARERARPKSDVQQGPFGDSDTRKRKMPSLTTILKVKSIDINDVEVLLPSRPAYKLRRLFLADLDVDTEIRTLSLGRFYVESDSIMFDVENVLAQDKTLSIMKPARLEIRPALFPEILNAPIDLSFEGHFENNKVTKLNVTGFGNRFRVNWDGESGEVVIANLTPLHYVKTELPFWNIDLKFAGELKKFRMTQLQGSIGLRNTRFQLDGNGFIHSRNGKSFVLVPRLSANWKAMLAGQDPGMILGSSVKAAARDVLSDLYFAKPMHALNESERALVERDQKYFADMPGISPMPFPISGVPIAPSASPALKRVPTSAPYSFPKRK